MSEWLTIDLVLALLIVTSFTCVGLIALWATTSKRHWFIRFAVNFAAIAPLLLVNAYEPFVAFTIQSVIVALGVAAYSKRAPKHRFSLSGILLVMIVVAIAVVVAARLPRLNLQAWVTAALNGACAGIAALVGAWWLVSPRKKLAWPLGLLACIALGVALSMFDWFIPSIVGVTDWPPDPVLTSPATAFFETTRPVIAWLFIPTFTAFTVALILCYSRVVLGGLPERCLGPSSSNPQRLRRAFSMGGFVLSIALVAALPLFVLGKLLTPDTLPASAAPTPNAREDLVAAGRIANSTQLDGSFDIATATVQQLSPEVQKCAKAYDLVTSALQKPCDVSVDYTGTVDMLNTDEFVSFRYLARALAAKGRLAELADRPSEAANLYQQSIQLGYSVRRGGLLIHALVGCGCTSHGTAPLFEIRHKLPADQLQRHVRQLTQLDAHDEPYGDFERRDRVWSQGATGWHGHLSFILSECTDWSFDYGFYDPEDTPLVYSTHQAVIRLLLCELALAQFHHENARWPATLDELVPTYLPAVPVDPFSSDNAPLKYRSADGGCVLYSIAANHTDDGGTPPSEDNFMGIPKTGDLRLDVYFAPDEEASGQTGIGPSPASPTDSEPK
jgi:hypothetical protein